MATKKKGKAKATKGTKTKKLHIDFGGVEKDIRKRGKKIPEGDYLCKITKGKVTKNKDGNGRHILWSFQVIEDVKGNKKHKGAPLWTRTSLKPEALFSLRNLIFAASDGKKNVAGKALDFNPDSLAGSKVGVTVEHEEYDGKMRNNVVDVLPPSQLVDEDDEDEEDEEEEEDEDEDEEDEEDEDEEEEDEDEEEEDDDEDEDDEDELDDVDDDDL